MKATRWRWFDVALILVSLTWLPIGLALARHAERVHATGPCDWGDGPCGCDPDHGPCAMPCSGCCDGGCKPAPPLPNARPR